MVDSVSASTLVSANPISAPSSTGATVQVPASLSSLPPGLGNLSSAIQIPATVADVSTDSIILSTSQGIITLSLAQIAVSQQQNTLQQLMALLSTQRPFTLLVQPGAPPEQGIMLLPIGNVLQLSTSQQLGTQSQPQAQILQPQELPIAVSPNTPISVGTILTAIVMPPESNATPPLDRETVQNISLQPVEGNNEPESILPIPAPIPSNDGPEIGTPFSLRVDQIITAPNSQVPSIQNPNQFLATVDSVTSNGRIILSVNNVSLYIKENVTAPVDSTLLLTVEPAKTSGVTVLSSTSASLPSLLEAISSMKQIDPSMTSNLIETRIPQFNNTLGSTLLFFMSSLKQGNLQDWLGTSALNVLSYDSKENLLTKISQELAGMSGSAKDPTVGEWRYYPLPIYENNAFKILDLYVHNNPDRPYAKASAIQPASGYLRFLIDMHMSKLGLIQLDGLVQAKKLDIILRSEQTLPEGLHRDLRETYTNTLSGMDYSGSLSFQVGRQGWLNVQKNTAQTTVFT